MMQFDVHKAHHCYSCGVQTSKHNALYQDFGYIPVRADMMFCTEVCRSQMVGLMLANPGVPERTRHSLLIQYPVLARQMSIECNLDSCPQHRAKIAAEAAAAKNREPQPPSDAGPDASVQQDAIEASILSKLREKLPGGAQPADKQNGPASYTADTTAIAHDIVKRVEWYRQAQGGLCANIDAIRSEGAQVLEAALSKLVRLGYTNTIFLRKTLETISEQALSEIQASVQFFPAAKPLKQLKKPAYSDDTLTTHLAHLFRRSTPEGSGVLINTAQLNLDIRTIYNKVVFGDEGEAGYTLLAAFLFDASTAGVGTKCVPNKY